MYINLMLSGFWLAIGLSFLFYHYAIDPNTRFGNLFNTGIPAGWLAIFLALYNLVRWWSAYSYVKDKEMAEDRADEMRDRQRYRSLKMEIDEPLNPDFDFTKKDEGESASAQKEDNEGTAAKKDDNEGS